MAPPNRNKQGPSGSHAPQERRLDVESRPESEVATYKDIKKIAIPRRELLEWFRKPFFDELMVGCLVRVRCPKSSPDESLYYLHIVRSVDANNPSRWYDFEGQRTHKYLANDSARFEMSVVSNSPPTEEEYHMWAQEAYLWGRSIPTKVEVAEKKLAIRRRRFIEEERALEKRFGGPPLNKGLLLLEYPSNKDAEAAWKSQGKAMRIEELNRRNRAENLKPKMKPAEGNDPYSRRLTKPTKYYVPRTSTGHCDVSTAAAAAMSGEAANNQVVDESELADDLLKNENSTAQPHSE